MATKSFALPELPDLKVLASNLNTHLAGKKLAAIKIHNGKKLKDKPM